MSDPTNTPKVSFTSRTFNTFLQDFYNYIRATRPAVYTDFSQADLGSLLVEMAAAVVDNVSYGQDVVAQEIFLSTCQRYGSALRFAKSVGYVPRLATAAVVTLKSSSSLPATLIANGGTIPKGTVIKGQNGLTYELQEDYTVAIGDTVVRLTMKEGASYSEEFPATAQQNQVNTVSSGVAEDGSWEVYVGDPTNSANLWTQVVNVNFETSATKTYDVSFDDSGKLSVRFGDGSAGLVPTSAQTINYRTTDGAAGNAPVSSITGSVKVTLTSPGTGTVSVAMENRDDEAAVSGGTQLHSNESQGTTAASGSQSGTTAAFPILTGSLVLTLILPSSAGTLVLQDTGLGTFTVVSNTSARSLVSSAITYSTGAWSLVLDSAVAAGGLEQATYFALVASEASAAALVGAAVGGEDRESLSELKKNIPAYIRSQDKVLTAQDYDDGLSRLSGVALSFVVPYISSYTANLVKVHVWGSEAITVQSEDSTGLTGTPVPYTRYTQIEEDGVAAVQAYLSPRSLLTVSNVILRPAMLWVDLYFGTITYDRRQNAATVRAAIVEAVVGVFEAGSGFAVRLADVYQAVRVVPGVGYFTLLRASTGTQQTSEELQGTTASSATVAGTLLAPVCTPGTLEVTIDQTSSLKIVLADDGSGNLVLKSGVATLSSGMINYRTGAWTATFSASLVPNQQVTASYANVLNDYREDQIVTIDSPTDGDPWPPPGVTQSFPVGTPPYKDGVPLSAERANVAQVAPWLAGDVLTYDKLQDITVDAALTGRHFYNDEFLYNNEIYYDSVDGVSTDVRAINLRRIVFDLAPA